MGAERIAATYRIETPLEIARAAEVLAGEQSSGTFVAVPGETADLRQKFDRPTLFSNLEEAINNATGGPERLRKTQEFLASLAARMSETADKKKKDKHDSDGGDEKAAGA
jgi:hypothetical protein